MIAPFLGFSLLSLVCYGGAISGPFLNWDDNTFLVDNPVVHRLSFANLSTLFTSLHQQVYTPLHFLSTALQYSLWGAWAPGFHVTNILVFALGLTLLYRLLLRLGVARLAALAATALYAAHPSHVESVAWITGLKDVQSFAFAMAATLFHLGTEAQRRRPVLSFAFFLAALLSKNTLIVLPALLFLLDWGVCRTPLRRSALRVLPHLALAALLTWVVQSRWKEQQILRRDSTPVAARIGDTYWHYLRTTLLPIDLSPLYPARLARGWTGGAVAGLVVPMLLGVLCLVRRWWWALAALAWFVLALSPMSNIVPLYYRVNDRYLILPTLSIALVTAHLLSPHLALGHRSPNGRSALAVTLAVAATWGALTAHQSRAWTSDRRLWTLATRRQPDSYYAWLKLGEALGHRGQYQAAMDAYAQAVRRVKLPSGFLKLNDAALRSTLGAGRRDPAYNPLMRSYAKVLRSPEQLLALASVLERRRLFAPAWVALFTARSLSPRNVEIRLRLASSWLKRKRPAQALRVLGSPPQGDDEQRRYLTYKFLALRGLHRRDEATAVLRKALQRFPDDPVLKQLAGR